MADQVRIVETRFIPTDRTSDALDSIAVEAKRADAQLDEVGRAAKRASREVKATGEAMQAVPKRHVERTAEAKADPVHKQAQEAVKEAADSERDAARQAAQERRQREKDIARYGSAEKAEEARRLKQERSQYALEKEEMMLSRARLRGLQLEDREEKVAEQFSSAMLSAMLASSNEYIGKLQRTGAALQSGGYALVSMGGHAAELGTKLAKFGGTVGVVTSALEVGYSIGEKMLEIGEGLDNLLGRVTGTESMFGEIWGEGHQRSLERVNLQFAKSLGFLSAKHYEEANEAVGRANHERKLAKAIEEQRSLLKALPTDKTGAAMEEFEQSLLQAAKTGQRLDVGMAELLDGLRESASHSAATQEARANRKSKLEEATREQVIADSIVALPDTATLEMKQAQAAKVRAAVEAVARMTGASDEEVEQIQEMTLAHIEAHDSLEGVMAAFDDEAQGSLQVQMAAKEAEKHVKHFSAKTLETAKGMEEYLAAIKDATMAAAKKAGIDKDPKQVAKVLNEVKAKVEHKVFDFRGSRFDILQRFEEGFDPDRIAAAFAGDVADLGERSVQSNFAPLFSVHG